MLYYFPSVGVHFKLDAAVWPTIPVGRFTTNGIL